MTTQLLVFLSRITQIIMPGCSFNKDYSHQLWTQQTATQCFVFAAPTLVPDSVLRGVDLRPMLLLNPGQGCGSGPLGSLTGPMTRIPGGGAALRRLSLGLRTAAVQRRNERRWSHYY